MGRPRAFDEAEVIRSAAKLFASRAYDGISVDDLVNHLGVHRNSLYKTFGSKRGLYLAALRWQLQQIRDAPSLEAADLDLLLLAAVERAPADPEVAEQITSILQDFDTAAGDANSTATILGLRLRARINHHQQ